jgi:DNA-binding PadR family transcriptional regulator
MPTEKSKLFMCAARTPKGDEPRRPSPGRIDTDDSGIWINSPAPDFFVVVVTAQTAHSVRRYQRQRDETQQDTDTICRMPLFGQGSRPTCRKRYDSILIPGPTLLPLPRNAMKTAPFHILLALREAAAHGFEIRRRVEEQTGGEVRLWPATLYGSIRRLAADGQVEALEGEDDPDHDARRRYYRLTAVGRAALLAEAERLEAFVRAARGTGTLRQT